MLGVEVEGGGLPLGPLLPTKYDFMQIWNLFTSRFLYMQKMMKISSLRRLLIG